MAAGIDLQAVQVDGVSDITQMSSNVLVLVSFHIRKLTEDSEKLLKIWVTVGKIGQSYTKEGNWTPILCHTQKSTTNG